MIRKKYELMVEGDSKVSYSLGLGMKISVNFIDVKTGFNSVLCVKLNAWFVDLQYSS